MSTEATWCPIEAIKSLELLGHEAGLERFRGSGGPRKVLVETSWESRWANVKLVQGSSFNREVEACVLVCEVLSLLL